MRRVVDHLVVDLRNHRPGDSLPPRRAAAGDPTMGAPVMLASVPLDAQGTVRCLAGCYPVRHDALGLIDGYREAKPAGTLLCARELPVTRSPKFHADSWPFH